MKRILSFAIAITFIFISSTSYAQTYTFELWNWMPEYEKTFWDKAAEEFNKVHPNSTVKVTYKQVDYLEMFPSLKSITTTSERPDIQSIEFNQWASYLKENPSAYFESLNDIVSKLGSNVTQSHLKEFTDANTKYAISFQASPMVLLYRDDLVKTHGLTFPINTWKDFLTTYTTLNEKNLGTIGFDAFDYQVFYALFLQAGGTFPTSTSEQMSQKSREIFVQVAEMMKTVIDTKRPTFGSTQLVNGQLDEEIRSGNYIAFVTGDWSIPILKNRFPDLAGKWKVQPLPSWGTGYACVAVGGTGYAIVKKNRTPSELKTLKEFMEFAVYSLKMQTNYYKDFSIQMSNLQLANNKAAILFTDEYFGGQKLAYDLREAIKNIAPRPVVSTSDDINRMYATIMTQFFEGKITEEELMNKLSS